MNKPENTPTSQEHCQQALVHTLRGTCQVLQMLEQKMILTGYRSDEIAARMRKVRQTIQRTLSDHR